MKSKPPQIVVLDIAKLTEVVRAAVADAMRAHDEDVAERARAKGAGKYAPYPRGSRVYFIGSEDGSGLIKIGTSSDVQARLRCLQTGSPVKLSLLADIDGDSFVELRLHHKFAPHREHGEWFRRHPDVLRVIETVRERVARRGAMAVVEPDATRWETTP